MTPRKENLFIQKIPIFALPSHPAMFTLLAMFSGRLENIPRKPIEKPQEERTSKEQEIVDIFLNSIIRSETKKEYIPDGRGTMRERNCRYAFICDTSRVIAEAKISGFFFQDDEFFGDEALAIYIKKCFGAEGLRHFLGLIIGLDENFRQGFFEWNINEHLERLGYTRSKKGAFDPRVKFIATQILKIFTSFLITATEKKKTKDGNEKIIFSGEKLFNIDGFRGELLNKEIIDERLTLRATDFWYRAAFEPSNGKAPTYTKLLQEVARENHKNHPDVIFLAPLLAIFWRINSERKFSVKNLLDWCDCPIEKTDKYKLRKIRILERELDYMVSKKYLGKWESSSESRLPSEHEDPLSCILTLTPPEWLTNELEDVKKEKRKHLHEHPPKYIRQGMLTKDEIQKIYETSVCTSYDQFADKLGVSKTYISYIFNGKRKISKRLSDSVKDIFLA